jgi:hypothetical protein
MILRGRGHLLLTALLWGCGSEQADAAGPPACHEVQSINVGTPVTNCFQGPIWVAWRVSLSCQIDLKAIDLFDSGGAVAILQDSNGSPGDLLWKATVPDVGGPQWQSIALTRGLVLQPGVIYWVATNNGRCSEASDTEAIPYYTGDNLAGPWAGPILQDAPMDWMVKFEPR